MLRTGSTTPPTLHRSSVNTPPEPALIWGARPYAAAPAQVTEHSTPFLVRIAPGEHAPAVQERMRQRLGTPAEEFNAWPLSVVSANAQHPVVPVPQDLYDQLLPMYQVQPCPCPLPGVQSLCGMRRAWLTFLGSTLVSTGSVTPSFCPRVVSGLKSLPGAAGGLQAW